MKNFLKQCDTKTQRLIRKVSLLAAQQRTGVYIVGGVVRDIILKKKIVDLDIVVEGNAHMFGRKLAQELKGRLVTFEAFRTAKILFKDGFVLDLATARAESYSKPGALPVVRAGDLTQDLLRRDFTINAMAISINQGGFGELFDLCGGLKDLKSRKIRILHEKSFLDDPTRLLRAVRFEQRFGFRIEPSTLKLFKQAIRKGAARHVKPPRYFDEFRLMFEEKDPLKNIRRLKQLGCLSTVDQGLKVNQKNMRLVQKNIHRLRNKYASSLSRNDWFIFFLTCVDAASQATLKRIVSRFHFTKHQKAILLKFRKHQDAIQTTCKSKTVERSLIFRALKTIPEETIFYTRLCSQNAKINQRIDQYLTKDRFVHLKINGHDLKQIGLSSGTKMGRIMNRILDEKINRKIQSKREELQLAKALLA